VLRSQQYIRWWLAATRTIGKARLYRLDSGNLVVQDIKRIERRLSLAAANEED